MRRKNHDAELARQAEGELRVLPLKLVDEPLLPAREGMNVEAMQELVESMRDVGMLSPIVVVERGDRFSTVAGHRRLLAARELKWESIRALVYPRDWEDSAAAMLHENIIREALNAAQEAVFFAQLLETRNLDEEGLCRAVKRSPSYVAERLKLLRGSERVFLALRQGEINFAVAKVLNRFPEEEWRLYYLDQAIRSGTSAAIVEVWLNDFLGRVQPPYKNPAAEQREQIKAEVENAQSAHVFECFVCGGSKDPYNLVTVQIHKWELAAFVTRMRRGQEEVESAAEEHLPAPPVSGG